MDFVLKKEFRELFDFCRPLSCYSTRILRHVLYILEKLNGDCKVVTTFLARPRPLIDIHTGATGQACTGPYYSTIQFEDVRPQTCRRS